MTNENTNAMDDSLDWITALRTARDGVLQILTETEGAFLSHKVEQASAALALVDKVSQQCDKLTEVVVARVQNGAEKSDSGVFQVRVVGNVGRLAREIAAVIEAVRRKIEGRVLFSNKAVQELKDLFNLVRKAIGDIFDGIETGNQTLLVAVVSASEEIAAKANASATEHEERLVAGVCQPKSSAMFLDLIYSLRSISHTLKMLVKDVPDRDR